jgi:hypothetical protein
MSFARGRIVLVAVSIQTDYETGDKGVRGMRSLHSGIPQGAQKTVSKAAGASKPEAYPQGYVEDFDEPRAIHGNKRVSARWIEG